MYTGIIDHLGEITTLTKHAIGMHLIINTEFSDLVEGESIAIDGICVTVINPRNNHFECDLSPETLKLTTASHFKVGQKLNMERSMQANDRFGGHFVMGHVDTIAKITVIESHANFTKLTANGFSEDDMLYLVKKGSVSVNGISLTINEVSKEGIELMIIPHTKQRTNLQFLQEGNLVNIEFDTIARVIVNQMKRSAIQ